MAPMPAIRVSTSTLPSANSISFPESSFFAQPNAPSTLPSPAQVRAAADVNDPRHDNPTRAELVRFPALNLMVKFGHSVTIAEGQCLWTIRRLLRETVPVPEVFGWFQDHHEVFIYMKLVRGVTLEERWGTLSTKEKKEVCEQLRHIAGGLDCLEQDPVDKFVGHIGRQPLLDVIFTSSGAPEAGPFPSIASFHDFFSQLPHPYDPQSPHPHRSNLPDRVPIKFTHGDLHRSNILLLPEGEGPRSRIVSVIDWHQSGWFPAYWEFCKAHWTTRIGDEWETKYIPTFLESFGSYDYWDFFVLRLGI